MEDIHGDRGDPQRGREEWDFDVVNEEAMRLRSLDGEALTTELSEEAALLANSGKPANAFDPRIDERKKPS